MSVSSWKRKISNSQFVYELFELNKRVGKIVMNCPKKYRSNYGDNLIKRCDEAMAYAQRANDIYLTNNSPKVDVDERRRCLIKARGIVTNIPTTASLFLELTADCDGVNEEKIYKWLVEIGEKCDSARNLINGVIEHDKKFQK